MTPDIQELIAKLEKAERAATPGPWIVCSQNKKWHSHCAAGATEFYPARQRGEPDNPVSDDEVIWLDSELPYMAVEAVI